MHIPLICEKSSGSSSESDSPDLDMKAKNFLDITNQMDANKASKMPKIMESNNMLEMIEREIANLML